MGKFDNYINVTAPIHSATVKGKLGNANEIFLEGDTQNIENEIKEINSRHEELNKKHDTLSSKHESLSKTVQGIAATGGASTANNVTYNNDSSKLNAENAQDAIDELQGSKIDKTSILQKSGDAEDKVISQKAVTQSIKEIKTDLEAETARAKDAEQAIIFDVSAYNNGAFFKSISDLLGNSNLDTLIPVSFRHGGMTIRYVQSSDNKYVQFRLMSNMWSTNVADWQGVDNEPTVGSDNLVKSGGVADKISELERKTKKESKIIPSVQDSKSGYPILIDRNNISQLQSGSTNTVFFNIENFVSIDLEYNFTNSYIADNGGICFSKSIIETGERFLDFSVQRIAKDLSSGKITIDIPDGAVYLAIPIEFVVSIYAIRYVDADLAFKEELTDLEIKINKKLSINPFISSLVDIKPKTSSSAIIDRNFLYKARYSGYIDKYDISIESNPILVKTSKNNHIPWIKNMTIAGDYLYAVGRGYGSGMRNDLIFPKFYAPFEGGWGDMSEHLDGWDEYEQNGDAKIDEVGEPSPSRWQFSARLIHKSGDFNNNNAYLKKSMQVDGDKFFGLWLKVPETLTNTVYIPILRNGTDDVVSLAIDSNKHLGLCINGYDTFGDNTISNEWVNLKINIIGSIATLYCREKECKVGGWNEFVSADASNTNGDYLVLGIKTSGAYTTILVDDYVYDTQDVDNTTCKLGYLSVYDKNTMEELSSYRFNLRCLCVSAKENKLYVGQIGGILCFDISDPRNLKLLSWQHKIKDSVKQYWPPVKEEDTYRQSVQGYEIQDIDIFSIDSSEYIVGGCDVAGIVIYKLNDDRNIEIVSKTDANPKIPVKTSSGASTTAYQYIEWGVICKYPFVYSTVAALHSLRNGTYIPDNPDDIVFGICIRDISDFNNIISKLSLIDKNDYNTFSSKDADSLPNTMTIVGDKIIIDNGDKGISLFKAKGFDTEYIKSVPLLYNGRISGVSSTYDGRVSAIDKEGNICYVYKGIL